MIKRIVALVVIIAIGAVAVWVGGQYMLASNLAQADEWAAIQQTNAVLQSGSKPADWPVRGFVPASTLQSALVAFQGADIIIPVGQPNDGHVDGFVHLVIRSGSITPGDVYVRARLTASAKYTPDRNSPWWRNVTADVNIDAILLPNSQTWEGDTLVTKFRIIPNSITLAAGYNNLDIRVIWFSRVLAADEVAIHLQDALVLPIPSLSPSFDLDASVDSTSFQPFGGVEVPNSGTNVTVKMRRDPKSFKQTFDQWLLTRSGVWVLGGKQVTPPSASPTPSSSEISAALDSLKTKLEPFQQTDSAIQLTLPGKALTDFVDSMMQPSPLDVAVTTSQTQGNVTDAIVIHNDKVLGNVGLEVRPKGDNFASGHIAVSPEKSSWSARSGLNLPVSLKGTANVTLDIHLATGIGGGIGSTVTLNGGADVPHLLVQAPFQLRTVPQGSAILLQPQIPCVPAVIQVYPGTEPAISEPWVVVSPLGLELDREIGGMKIAPAVLFDSLPVISKLPTAQMPDGTPAPPDPQKTVVHFSHPFLSMVFSPVDVLMDETGITVRATAAISSRDKAETDAEKSRRDDLRHALKDAAPSLDCKTMTSLKIVGGGTTLVDLYKEYVYIGQSLKNHLQVANDVLKALTDIDPRNTPDNLTKLADAVGTSVTYDAQHLWETVTHPPTASTTVGGTTVTAGPTGISVSGTVGGTHVDVSPTHVCVGGVHIGGGC
jgi:hypothetical protein